MHIEMTNEKDAIMYEGGKAPLRVYSAGRRILQAGESWGPGMRSRWMLCRSMEGEGELTLDENTYTLPAGAFFLIPPERLLSLASAKDSSWEYAWVRFGGSMASMLVEMAGLESGPVLPGRAGEEITPLFLEIEACAGPLSWQRLSAGGAFFCLFSQLIRSAEGRGVGCEPDCARVVAEYIVDHFENPITVEGLAAYAGVSHSSLYRRFVARYGVSPKRFLLEYRVERACWMLRNTSCSVQQIAISVGFEDPFYFSRAFKEVKGVSPRQYANSCDTEE